MKNKKLFYSVSSLALVFGAAFALSIGCLTKDSFKSKVSLAQSINEQLKMYTEKYYIREGENVEEKTAIAIEEVSKYTAKLKNLGQIKSYSVDERSITIKHNCGLITAFTPSIENTLGDNVEVYNNLNIVFFQTIYSEQVNNADHYTGPVSLPDGINRDEEAIPIVARQLTSTHEHISLDEKGTDHDTFFQDIPLNRDLLQKIGPNQLIMFMGHGTYIPSLHCVMQTGRGFSYDEYLNDPIYKKDVDDGLIVTVDEHESITTKFIDKYVGDITNSFVYLGECQSAMDDGLPHAFLDKGASAVIANTDTVEMRYGTSMEYQVFHNLLTADADGNLPTLEKALQDAKDEFGQKSPGSGAITKIYGNKDYRLDKHDIAPYVVNRPFYTGKEIQLAYPGVGFTYDEGSELVGTDARNYLMEATLKTGYCWQDGSTGKGDFGTDIVPADIKPNEYVAPKVIPGLVTGGAAVQLLTPGSCSVGTMYYVFNGEEYETVPKVNKAGTYEIGWYIIGDSNHNKLGDIHHCFVIKVTVGQTIPNWLLAVLIALGAGAVITLAVLTGKKVKKLSKEK